MKSRIYIKVGFPVLFRLVWEAAVLIIKFQFNFFQEVMVAFSNIISKSHVPILICLSHLVYFNLVRLFFRLAVFLFDT